MKSRARSGKDFSEFLLVIGVVMACVIMPVFFFFLHSLYKVCILCCLTSGFSFHAW